jgi:hypothetical protein
MIWDVAKTGAIIIIFGFFWRYLSARQAGTKTGAAMAFIY